MQMVHDLFERVSERHFHDGRTTFAHLHLTLHNGSAHVSGEVLDQTAATTFFDDLRAHAPDIEWRDTTTTLVDGPHYSWATVEQGVIDIRRTPHNSAERITQALWGEICELLQIEGDWALVRTADGYLGWTPTAPLRHCDEHSVRAWREACTHLVCAPLAPVFADAARRSHEQSAILPFGTRVPVTAQTNGAACIVYPHGQECWINSAHLLPLDEVPQRSSAALHWITQWLPQLIGTPYLWGGKTPWGYDCSGLTQLVYAVTGCALPRDADQQYAAGRPVSPDAVACGDLLFFDTDTPLADLATPPTYVTHVAFALDHATFVHASRPYGGVVWGSLDPQSPHFVPDYAQRLIGARRYIVD